FELGKYGINVNAIAPGLVPTDMVTYGRTEEEIQKTIEMAKSRAVLGRVGRPEDIANVALFLASDEASFITGQVIVADGGRVDYLTHSI
ncbi:MAG: SDR family oxidoreductase, partial [Thaumarchaeota archaeon]|nr:SDR family oxidoreductase [Nitrososphaerota archaeon]